MPNLIGLHDRESVAIAAPDTWALDTVALSQNPPPTSYRSDLHWITRINHGYGSTGTLPIPEQYNWFSERVAQYVQGSRNCRRWIIGNEPSLRREWPDGQPIYPWHYAAAFKLCRKAIHALSGHEHDEVLLAGSGPWNAELQYMSNPHGDWIQYFAECIDLCDGQLDGFALHAYTHGYDPALVTSTARMDAPFHNRYYNFFTYRDYCDAIPDELLHLPVYITEANGDGPWQATSLMPAMLDEINAWNYSGNVPLIQALIFYRYPRYDQFFIEGRGDVEAEYQAAAARGYISPAPEQPPEPEPEPPTPAWPPFDPAQGKRDIDPALYARGVTFDFAKPPAGTGYWRITYAKWLDEQEADDVGPDHHILGKVLRDFAEVGGVPMRVDWPSGQTTIHSKPNDPNASYNFDFGMSPSLNEFAIQVDDGAPSDRAMGIGMGAGGNPGVHSSTWIDFVWTIAQDTELPIPTPPAQVEAGFVTAQAGLNLRAEPNTDAEIYGTLAYRSTVLYQGEHNGWLHTVPGWVSGDWVDSTGSPQVGEVAEPAPVPPSIGDGLQHPLPGSIITQHFYQHREMYEQFGLLGHDGTDLGGRPQGTPVLCMAHGRVTRATWDDAYGNYIMVAHDHLSAYTMYCHASQLLVDVGQQVSAGQEIMLLGSTGNSTGPHLHLSVRMMNPDGSFKENTPMIGGRVDPQTWAYMYGLEL